MNLLKCLLIDNRCYKTNAKIKPRGIMVHSTGANNPMLRRYVQPSVNNRLDRTTVSHDPSVLINMLGINPNRNDWNRDGQMVNGKWVSLSACVHAFIGKLNDGSVAVVQTLPWDHRGWHAGTGTSRKSANDTHISFEICEDALKDASYFNQTYKAAVELCAMLCEKYSLDPMDDGVIICHQDGFLRGVASNHGDIYNWWPNFGHFMNEFRADVRDKMVEMGDNMEYYKYYGDIPEYYQAAIQKCVLNGALKGTDDDGALNVSEDFCRVMTVLDRLGKLD